MIGPTVDRSTRDGELAGDATALTAGALLTGAEVGGNELGASLAGAVDAAADEATGALLATDAEWCEPEHAANSRPAASASAGQRRIDIPHSLAGPNRRGPAGPLVLNGRKNGCHISGHR